MSDGRASQGPDSAGDVGSHAFATYEMLYDRAVCIALGATVLDNLTGSPVEIPKQTGGATAYWPGENAAITGSDLTLDQLSLSPKAVGCLVKLSNRLIQLSNPSAEVMVRRDIATALALAIDLKALRGDGTSNTPTGIANTSIHTVAIGTRKHLTLISLQMIDELDVDNALKGKLDLRCIQRSRVMKKHSCLVAYEKGVCYDAYDRRCLKRKSVYDFQTSNQIPTSLTSAEQV